MQHFGRFGAKRTFGWSRAYGKRIYEARHANQRRRARERGGPELILRVQRTVNTAEWEGREVRSTTATDFDVRRDEAEGLPLAAPAEHPAPAHPEICASTCTPSQVRATRRLGAASPRRRSAKERVAHDQRLPHGATRQPSTPNRCAEGHGRREYDRVRHHWRQELLHKVDEDVDPVRRSLIEAYGALVTGDRDGFVDAMNAALAERARRAMTRQKFRMIADLLQSGATEEPEEGEE